MASVAMDNGAVGQTGAAFWAGSLLALGAAGIVATSVFYGMSPREAAMPQPTIDLAAAVDGAIKGARTMRLAGLFGVAGDVLVTAAAFLLATRVAATDAAAASGWFLIGVSTIIFAIVDAIVGFVLTPLAEAGGGTPFLGMRQLLDTLFLLGTATFGAGAVLATIVSAFGYGGIIARLLAVLAFVAGAVALATGAGSLMGVHLERFVGFGILGGSAIFTLIGLQIALTRRV